MFAIRPSILSLSIIALTMSGCFDYVLKLDVQGHRGCRGRMPENTVEGFVAAIEMGVTTLEMDVVITGDSQVLVSHEPWLSAEICTDTAGQPIAEAQEQSFNLYKMDYAEIARCDCGSKPHPRFPEQKKLVAHKPLLRDVIAAVEPYSAGRIMPIQYNIELKYEKAHDGVFHPDPETFVRLVWEVVEDKGIADHTTLQSFDLEILRVLQRIEPEQTLALLVDEHENYRDKLAELGFYPSILSPWHLLVDEDMVRFAAEKHLKVIPWTVNEVEDMQRLIDLQVNGIITDYPDRLVPLLKE